MKESYQRLQEIIDNDSESEDENVDPPVAAGTKQNWRVKERTREQQIYRCPIDGQIKPLGPKSTAWYTNYILNPDTTSNKFQRKFRRCFQMSYESFKKHLGEVKESDFFDALRFEKEDCTGKKSSPMH